MAQPRSICFTQHERGANGTLHLQGYAQRANPTRFHAWKAFISERAHLEAAKGTPQQNRVYCTKDESRVPGSLIFEHGTIPVQGKRRDLDDIAAAIVAGQSLEQLASVNPAAIIQYGKGLQALRTIVLQPRRWKTCVFWFYGPTGTGKTLKADQLCPNAYWKMGGSKWWDGYDGHEDIIIDDFRKDLCTFHELLRLLDRYPHKVECKGGTIQFCPRRIFITTPQSPLATWDGRTEEDIAQLTRRIEHVEFFGVDGIRRVDRTCETVAAMLLVPENLDRAGDAGVEAIDDVPDEPAEWEASQIDDGGFIGISQVSMATQSFVVDLSQESDQERSPIRQRRRRSIILDDEDF